MPVVQEIYFISMAARELGMHPQTLRKYDRLGLVQPSRRVGTTRVYSREEIERLRLIKHLVDELGINLAGVQRLLSAADVVQRMRRLAREEAAERSETRRRLVRDLEHLSEILGL
jgi:MerR family transcriptional regulator/heat shock protein HspR